MTTTDDPIKGLTKRQMEELKGRLEKELQACVLCDNVGAVEARISIRPPGSKGTKVATIKICEPCFEANRLPEVRTRA